MEQESIDLKSALREEMLINLLAFLLARDAISNETSLINIYDHFTRLFSAVGSNTAEKIGLSALEGEAVATEFLDHIFSTAESMAVSMREDD
jgi:hypothetical protein